MVAKCILSCQNPSEELSSTCRTASWICPLLISLNVLRFLKMAAMRFLLYVISITGRMLNLLMYALMESK